VVESAKKSKKASPYYKMLWSEDIPKVISEDANGNLTEIDVIAGELNGQKALLPNPVSWAADVNNNVQIWTIKLNPNAKFSIEGTDESLVQHGPFVANSEDEIQEAMQEYRKTQFGGWPYSTNEPVHDKNSRRFAKFVDGKTEKK